MQVIELCAQFYTADVFHSHNGAVGLGADDDVAEICLGELKRPWARTA